MRPPKTSSLLSVVFISRLLLVLASASLLPLASGCNDHPVNRVDEALTAAARVENRLPAKTKIDFLFVIDNSESMCEEQVRLSESFNLFSRFLFDELGGAADYRIAVVSTDIGLKGNSDSSNPQAGRFVYSPAPTELCGGGMSEFIPPTEDCPAPSELINPVISSAHLAALDDASLPPGETREARLRAELERQFRCRANLKSTQNAVEKGLEAMRMALSCKGPNAGLFGSCCVSPGTPEAFYNPACEPAQGEEPEFLRPDATLAVILISDEDDCSTPADAPTETSRLICRVGGTVDGDGDGVPDVYSLCGESGISAAECYQRECGALVAEGAARCREERCDVSNYGELMNCQYERGRMTSVREYRDFLWSLKARPLDQLLFAPIVGFRTYTSQLEPLVYNGGTPRGPECVSSSREGFDVDMCCPEGVCGAMTTPVFACEVPSLSVSAQTGARYLDLAEALGPDGALGCASGDEPIVDVTAGSITPREGASCLSICEPTFEVPLLAIKARVATLINTYCLDRLPQCVVPDGGEGRACATDEERASAENYAVQVSRRCDRPSCEVVEPLRVIPPGEWSLRVGEGGCVGQVVLSSLPPAGSEIIVEFLSAIEQGVGEGD